MGKSKYMTWMKESFLYEAEMVKFKDDDGREHEIGMDTAKQYAADVQGGDNSSYKKLAVKAAGLDKDGESGGADGGGEKKQTGTVFNQPASDQSMNPDDYSADGQYLGPGGGISPGGQKVSGVSDEPKDDDEFGMSDDPGKGLDSRSPYFQGDPYGDDKPRDRDKEAEDDFYDNRPEIDRDSYDDDEDEYNPEMDQMNYDKDGNYMGPYGGGSDAGRSRRMGRSGKELKINGKLYREITTEEKKSDKETIKEEYDRLFTNRTVI